MIEPMVRHRVQIRFSKTGTLRFIGHGDLMRVIERLLRRTQLPLSMSEGYHPKVRMSFPSALALGVAGEEEVLELDLTEPLAASEVLVRLNQASCLGLVFRSAKEVAAGRKKAMIAASVFEMTISPEMTAEISRKIPFFLAETSRMVTKPNGKTVDVRVGVKELSLDGQKLQLELASTQGADAGFREVLGVLGLQEQLFRTVFPVRKAVKLVENEIQA